MLPYRAHTKHAKAVAPALQSLDFVSIAVNSVGGGGLPRPYGKFQACRAGDGNATWQRLPPQPGTWQAKALPIAVTLLSEDQAAAGGGGGSAPASSHRPASRSASPTHDAPGERAGGLAGPAPSVSPLRSQTHPPLRGLATSTFPGPAARGSAAAKAGVAASVPAPAPAGPGPGLGPGPGPGSPGRSLHEQSYYRRPGSSLHRSLVPLPPPEPHNGSAWFALPSATFLADVPTIPPQLRMDNGYSVSREFLMSGLHTKPQRQHRPDASSQYGDRLRWTADGVPLGAARDGAGSEAAGGGLVESLERSSHVPLHAYPPVVGPKGLRGVYVPIDNRAHVQQQQQQLQQQQQQRREQELLLQQQLLQQQLLQQRLQQQHMLQQMQYEQYQQAAQPVQHQQQQLQPAAEGGHASLLAGGTVTRGGLPLPPEQSLPRRSAPPGW